MSLGSGKRSGLIAGIAIAVFLGTWFTIFLRSRFLASSSVAASLNRCVQGLEQRVFAVRAGERRRNEVATEVARLSGEIARFRVAIPESLGPDELLARLEAHLATRGLELLEIERDGPTNADGYRHCRVGVALFGEEVPRSELVDGLAPAGLLLGRLVRWDQEEVFEDSVEGTFTLYARGRVEAEELDLSCADAAIEDAGRTSTWPFHTTTTALLSRVQKARDYLAANRDAARLVAKFEACRTEARALSELVEELLTKPNRERREREKKK